MRVDPTSLRAQDDAAGALRIRPTHVHRELRRVFGVDDQPFAARFNLPSADG